VYARMWAIRGLDGSGMTGVCGPIISDMIGVFCVMMGAECVSRRQTMDDGSYVDEDNFWR